MAQPEKVVRLVAAALAIAVLSIGAPVDAAEVSTDLAALASGGGKVALATDASPQMGIEVYVAGSRKLQWGVDLWGRIYRGPKWVGLAVGWRDLHESFAVLTVQSGYRLALAPDAFLDAGAGLQVRTNGFVGIVPRVYFGWRW